MKLKGRDFTDIHAFTRDEVTYLLDLAAGLKGALERRETERYRLARGRDLLAALLFYENSTRTRASFEIAARRLGLETVGFSGTEGTSVRKGESLRHTLDMFEAYLCDAVILRHPLDGSARFAADHLGIPVFNAGDGKHEHPTQTLLDLFTIREHLGRLDDIDVGLGGDLKYGRTVHSLAVALGLFDNVRLHLFSHPLLRMPESTLGYLRQRGLEYTEHESLEALLGSVDVFYQTRVQRERMPDEQEFEAAKDACRFRLPMMELTRPGFGLMHPLPINKQHPSIDPDVDAHPKAIYKRQAGNGVPTRLAEMALSLGLLGDDFQGRAYAPPQPADAFTTELEVVLKPPRTEQNIKPIRDSGTVIDHLQPHREVQLIQLLGVRERGTVYRSGTVHRKRAPGRIKGMLMLEDRELTNDELRMVATVSPGCRVNSVKEGNVVRKIALRLPDVIEGIPGLRCTNSGCITRPKYREHVAARLIRTAGDLLRCHFCGNLMRGDEVF
jgi:aspartate carbamoyltransferase catalytic subunit